MIFEIGEPAMLESQLMGGLEYHGWSGALGESLLPAGRTQAPTVAGHEARETVLEPRCREVVSHAGRKTQEVVRHLGTDDVPAQILRTGVAACISIEAGQRLDRTWHELRSENVLGHDAIQPEGSSRWVVSSRG